MKKLLLILIKAFTKKNKKSGFHSYCDYEKDNVKRVMNIKEIKYKGNDA
ncbi:hypothetical protein [Enterobacter hormaechei]|nr:hypothetical protein [Enterobacter hormaechei]